MHKAMNTTNLHTNDAFVITPIICYSKYVQGHLGTVQSSEVGLWNIMELCCHSASLPSGTKVDASTPVLVVLFRKA